MENIAKILEIIERRRYRRDGIIVIQACWLAIFLAIYDKIKDIQPDAAIRWLIWLLIALVIFLLWFRSRRLFPINEKGQIGILLAVTTQSDAQKNHLKNDFYKRLCDQLSQSKLAGKSKVFLLSNFHSECAINFFEKFSEYSERRERLLINAPTEEPKKTKEEAKAEKFLNKINCNLYMWGRIQERMQSSKPIYTFELRWLAKHTNVISLDAADKLSSDLTQAFPHNFKFAKDDEFERFQFSADLVYLASKYIIAITGLASNAIDFAIDQLLELKDELKAIPGAPGARHMREKVPEWLADAYSTRAKMLDEEGKFQEAESDCIKALEQDPKNYYSLLLLARVQFNLGQHLNSWKTILKAKAQSKGEFTCSISIAFLEMFFKEYPKAINTYDLAFKALPNTPNAKRAVDGAIAHIEKVLQEKPELIQLHFCLGFIKYTTGNQVQALAHFEKFIALASTDAEFVVLINKANVCLADIRLELAI